MIKDFKCKQCGVCCKYLNDAFCISVEDDDIVRWKTNSDFDILKRLSSIYVGNDQYVYDIWFHPNTDKLYPYCPWLRRDKANKYKYSCKIQGSKPLHCKNYPIDRVQALSLGCPGIQPKNSKEKGIRKEGLASLTIMDFEYKGFLAKTEYNKNTGIFKVRVFDVRNVKLEEYIYSDKNVKTTLEVAHPEDLEKEFHVLVNNYLKK